MIQTLRHLAFCGRFSSVNQRCESIDDQFRNIRQHLDRLDIPHDDALLIKDEAVSGAGVMGPECKKLMKMIDRGEIHSQHLKINAAWAAEYYRRRKTST